MFLNLQVPLLYPLNIIKLFPSLVCLKPTPGTKCIMAPLRPPAHIMVAAPPLRPPEHIMAAVMPQVPCICVVSSEVEQHKSYKSSRLRMSLLLVSSTDSSSVVCADEEARSYAAQWAPSAHVHPRQMTGYPVQQSREVAGYR